MIKNVLLLIPLSGNGGIASWAKKVMNLFFNKEFECQSIDISPTRSINAGYIERIFSGLKALFFIMNTIHKKTKEQHFDIMHITTSGNMGTLRDYVVAKYCKKQKIKTIMHCHYGCVSSDIKYRGLLSLLLRKTMRLYDQIWVLDTKSYNALNKFNYLRGKVFLTPNSIEIINPIDLTPKTYHHVAFIGNLIPSKGIFELVKAVILLEKYGVKLDIVGPGNNKIIEQLKIISGNKWGHTIKYHGLLPNIEAIKFMKSVDIIALPTYFPSEAFPISILEAMSLTKLVISTKRAAIPDILTSSDGTYCGILINEKSINEIVNAITYCIENSIEADTLSQKAYKKAFSTYRNEIVYEIYRNNYRRLLLL